jgi:hypothetical protein
MLPALSSKRGRGRQFADVGFQARTSAKHQPFILHDERLPIIARHKRDIDMKGNLAGFQYVSISVLREVLPTVALGLCAPLCFACGTSTSLSSVCRAGL